jgi:hypothetical protein
MKTWNVQLDLQLRGITTAYSAVNVLQNFLRVLSLGRWCADTGQEIAQSRNDLRIVFDHTVLFYPHCQNMKDSVSNESEHDGKH